MHKTASTRRALRSIRSSFTIDWPRLTCSPSRRYSTQKQHHETVDANNLKQPFYSILRWLHNEHLPVRIPERHFHFRIHKLCAIIAKSVDQSCDDITLFRTIAEESSSHRIFEATFRDGQIVIARLPYPYTVPQNYGVASEVATMEFLRLHGIPIPKVFDWSSSSSNSVGSEYIIMEKLPGKRLSSTWYNMTARKRWYLMEKIVRLEQTFFDIQFPVSGSIFYKNSLEPGVRSVDLPQTITDGAKFCIGPSTDYLWWFQNRHELSVSHGPWDTSEDVLKAVGERELQWLQKFGQPSRPAGANRLPEGLSQGCPYLVPKKTEDNAPTIRHPDLSPYNIFVSESGDITGVIDWRHTAILPIFLQAKVPKHFQYYEDKDSRDLKSPSLPPNFDTLCDGEKEDEMEIHRRRQVHCYYVAYTIRHRKSYFYAAAQFSLFHLLKTILYDVACKPWEGDNTSLQAELIHAIQNWSALVPGNKKPPVQYSAEETKECLERSAKLTEINEQLRRIPRDHRIATQPRFFVDKKGILVRH
ncbi:Altered inheritance of mitochondria protein 9, mitochondrial [Lachnellula cervina]|uniref:Altered inheritance of mitochondria protein 9, mitochondrial n=1 Tax=Lachnellula cervina TaxID=1316786 RepID=A0A7D8YSL9_9HELO|nr:Altered inheritance of mitochondria protein 9, mitochondrial [Lachnellula cervina]